MVNSDATWSEYTNHWASPEKQLCFGVLYREKGQWWWMWHHAGHCEQEARGLNKLHLPEVRF